ncbi:MAG: alpha/beta fold hydrolase [Janthinobacterium lividum]
MPLVDMPLEQLLTYTGRNPRPDDFDPFWDRSLAEMKSLDPQIELRPYPLKAAFAECFDLYFTGMSGARIHAKYLRPKNVPVPHPALVMFHGYGANSGGWQDKLGYVAQGFSVAALDVRGQGGFSQDVGGTTGRTASGHFIRGIDDGPEKMLFRQVFLDCAQLAGIVMDMPEVDSRRVGATGGSQGGALTLACAALEPRIKRAAPSFPFLSDYKRVWEMDLDIGAYTELRDYFRTFDPRHEREEELFSKLGYVDIQFLAPRIKATVLMAVGLMDTICPPSTQFAAYNKITAPKDLLIYPDFGHEDLPGASDTVFDFFSDL